MAKADSIPPFPADIDRTTFGHWLSGFTDGEGCFLLKIYWKPCNNRPRSRYRFVNARFSITLRADDAAVLDLIRSYFQCGFMQAHKKRPRGSSSPAGQKEKVEFRVCAVSSLFGIIVPHFDSFPLHAKKARDFSIWRQGISLCHSIYCRRAMSAYKFGRGRSCKWSPDEHEQLKTIIDALTRQRTFLAPAIEPAPAPHRDVMPELPFGDF